MANPPVSNSPLVSRHHAAIVGLTGKIKTALRSPQLLRLDKASAQYAAVFVALVQEFGSASISLNSDYYEDVREDAGVSGSFRTPTIEPAGADEIATSLAATLAPDPVVAQSNVEGLADLLVTSAGKDVLIAAIMGDGKAKKWARVTSAGACAFCRMLATKGAVYKSDASASFIPHKKCHCTIEAVFHPESYEPTAATRADAALYNAANENVRRGDQSNARLNAFRRAIEAQKRGETPALAKPRSPLTVSAGDRRAALQNILAGFGN